MSKYIRTPSYVDSMPVDISFIFENERPAGKHGFLQAVGEEFRFEDGTPGRFWGVCMNGGACFPSHEYSEQVADRLAMVGINCVRLHQLDGEFHVPNIFRFRKGKRQTDTRNFAPKSMDRLDYFIHCLKERGIYCYLDMMVFRHFKSGDGVVEPENLQYYTGRPYCIFDPQMIQLQKEYATNLWTHYNPYTGLQYKDDPVFILSEIINEHHIWYNGHRPSKGQKPFAHIPYYEQELRQMFAQWAEKNGIEADADTVDIWSREEPVVNRFKLEKTWEYNNTMYDHIRSLGVRIPLTGCNYIASEVGSYNIYAQSNNFEYMDNHHYYYDWAWGEEDKLGVNAQINGFPYVLGNLPKMRLNGKPFFVSEWGMPYPNSYRAEGPVYYAAVCALQGWSGMTIHTYAYGTNLADMDIIGKQYSSATLGGISYREGVFCCWNDPSIFPLFYHCALMVRRADITPANKKVGVRTPFVVQLSQEAFGTGAEKHRVVTLLDGMDESDCDLVVAPTDKIPQEKPGRIESDNGQMWRNLAMKFGGIDTERTKVLYGKLGKVGHGGSGIFPQPGTEVSGMKVESKTDFAVIALSSLTDDPIRSSDNLLLSTVGRSRNTDSQFDGESMVDCGHGPILSQVIHATITIETDRTDLCVWGVNAEGLLTGRVPATFADGKMTFTVGENFPCQHYLISAE